MQIVDFTRKHIEAAVQLTRQNYEDERGFVPALPPALILPEEQEKYCVFESTKGWRYTGQAKHLRCILPA